jgi:hypothetical protein
VADGVGVASRLGDAWQPQPELVGVPEASPEAMISKDLDQDFSNHHHDAHERQNQQQPNRPGYGSPQEQHDHAQYRVDTEAAPDR